MEALKTPSSNCCESSSWLSSALTSSVIHSLVVVSTVDFAVFFSFFFDVLQHPEPPDPPLQHFFFFEPSEISLQHFLEPPELLQQPPPSSPEPHVSSISWSSHVPQPPSPPQEPADSALTLGNRDASCAGERRSCDRICCWTRAAAPVTGLDCDNTRALTWNRAFETTSTIAVQPISVSSRGSSTLV